VALFIIVVILGVWLFRHVIKEKDHYIPKYGDEEVKVFNATRVIARSTAGFAIAGLIVVAALCLGFSNGSPWNFLSYLGTDIFVAAAAGAAGAVAGFIFGIPRTREAAEQVASGDPAVPEKQKSRAVLLANTNLERISDWLTTLLIGATLVQLRDLPGWLTGVGTALGSGLKNENDVPFVLVFFFGLGFLGIYMVTRLYLTAILRQTLDMISGGDGAPDTAGARAKLENALATNDAAEQLGAIQYVDRAGIKPDNSSDFDFSLALARTLIAVLNANAADDASRRKEDLKTVVGVIATDPPTTAKLKADLAGGTTTGDAALDTELTDALG
jgi:hypothetical protein